MPTASLVPRSSPLCPAIKYETVSNQKLANYRRVKFEEMLIWQRSRVPIADPQYANIRKCNCSHIDHCFCMCTDLISHTQMQEVTKL